jgi:hypothetical protein
MSRLSPYPVLALAVVLVGPAAASAAQGFWEGDATGARVGVAVEVEGRRAPLYPAPDGGLRHYFEAREGARYAVVLTNRTRERLGVVLTVDGLNAITGQRDVGRGRMYVLAPYEETTVRGWRSSLNDVRQFRFVDERASYAARTDQANGRMGWIEATVFREDRPFVSRPCGWSPCAVPRDRVEEAPGSWDRESAKPADGVGDEGYDGRSAPSAEAPPATLSESRPKDRSDDGTGRNKSAEALHSAPRAEADRSFPGTGWGERAYDPVRVVDFRAQAAPAEQVTLRYEYARTLRALGILPAPNPRWDRLGERERGSLGFAPPPSW